jgi:hypothetical protein
MDFFAFMIYWKNGLIFFSARLREHPARGNHHPGYAWVSVGQRCHEGCVSALPEWISFALRLSDVWFLGLIQEDLISWVEPGTTHYSTHSVFRAHRSRDWHRQESDGFFADLPCREEHGNGLFEWIFFVLRISYRLDLKEWKKGVGST